MKIYSLSFPPRQAKPRITRRRLLIAALRVAIAVMQLPIFVASAGTWRCEALRSRLRTMLDNEMAGERNPDLTITTKSP